MHPRYLTKSRFKLATECPTKLFYTSKAEYADKKLEDSFLQALAEGGFQVGELAKCYFPGGHDIHTLDYDEALRQTDDLMTRENVIIYEPAIRFKDLFIRIDVLVKKGGHLDLIEVKAKSIDADREAQFLTKQGTIKSDWKPYLYDVAFQKYVLSHAFPDSSISSYLMMADKEAACPTDGLNQKFRIVCDEKGRKGIEVSSQLTDEDLSPQILCKVNVDDFVKLIHAGKDSKETPRLAFTERISTWADYYARDEKIPPIVTSTCAKCEFRTSENDEVNGLKSGFKECWSEALGWSEKDFKYPTVLDIWNCRKKDQFIEEGRIKLDAISEGDINPKPDNKFGISASERQWLQIEKVQNDDQDIWFDKDSMSAEMVKWVFPLHFIDFETSMVAIPFNKGRHPYEGIAFQFSHHIVSEDGRVEHKGQYLNTKRGVSPNYDFVRALKSELDQDMGTIFRYSPHENTYLNFIYRQLSSDIDPIPDRDELCEFIRSITKSTGSSIDKWEGDRNMVDLWDLVKRYYYDPATNGSNSIKQVLPAILNGSQYLQDKYSKPIYGAVGGVPSLNFTNWQWIKKQDNNVVDPYKLLPKMFQDVSDDDFERLSGDDELAEGGAAMTAYARMQFEEMGDYERDELEKALLKYCELDTLAMVMIYEGWREFL